MFYPLNYASIVVFSDGKARQSYTFKMILAETSRLKVVQTVFMVSVVMHYICIRLSFQHSDLRCDLRGDVFRLCDDTYFPPLHTLEVAQCVEYEVPAADVEVAEVGLYEQCAYGEMVGRECREGESECERYDEHLTAAECCHVPELVESVAVHHFCHQAAFHRFELVAWCHYLELLVGVHHETFKDVLLCVGSEL